jgi:hypothetical protein
MNQEENEIVVGLPSQDRQKILGCKTGLKTMKKF